MAQKSNISIIYTDADSDAMLRISGQIGAFGLSPDSNIWNSDPIVQDQIWQPENEALIPQTDVFLLLISDHFMHSEFINQLEFKLIIDRYKDKTAKVLALLLDDCNWDIEFKSDDYDFRISELAVLPAVNQPLYSIENTERAYEQLGSQLRQIIAPASSVNTDVQIDNQQSTIKEEATREQLAIDFTQQKAIDQPSEDLQQVGQDEKPNESSYKEPSIVEEANVEEKTENAKIANQKSSQQSNDEAAQATTEIDESKLIPEDLTSPILTATESNFESAENAYNLKGKVLWGALIGILLLLLVWVFSVSKDDQRQPTSDTTEQNAIDTGDNDTDPEIRQSEPAEKTLAVLKPGDTFNGGIVFSISEDGKTGIIAHPEDAGKMTWNNAIQIHQQLGNDWRLPTLEELQMMYSSIGPGGDNSGGFSRGLYWSATEYDEFQARLLRFSDGNTSYHYNKELAHRSYLVRAVKDFKR